MSPFAAQLSSETNKAVVSSSHAAALGANANANTSTVRWDLQSLLARPLSLCLSSLLVHLNFGLKLFYNLNFPSE